MTELTEVTEEKQDNKSNNKRKVDLVCDAIGRYYKSLNEEYDEEFSLFCDENGFDDDGIIEELNTDYTECILIDFDSDFPFHSKLKNYKINEKQKFIFNLIRKCHENINIEFCMEPHLFFESYIKKTFNLITFEDIEDIRSIYKKQCDTIYKNGLHDDQNYLYLLALKRKCNVNYIQYFVDNFHQKRIKNKDKSYDETLWSDNCNFCKNYGEIVIKIPQSPNKEYTDNDKMKQALNIKILIQHAVKSFSVRCCRPIKLNPRMKINDSIEVCIRYIHSATGFIGLLIEYSKSLQIPICPFQMDFCIAFGPTSCHENINDYNCNDEDDDDDDDKKDIKDDDEFVDCIGSIKEKLENNKLKYTQNYLEQQYKFYYDYHSSRDFLKFFKDFKKIHDLDNIKNNNIYPNSKRFITFVDRRPNVNQNQQKETIWMYQAPTNSIPKDAVSEWYLSSSKTCLLPNINYDPEKIENASLKNANITSSFHCKGALLTISFHIKQMDEIQCYLYWNGGITRFFPQNIMTLLPSIFNMKWNNKEKLKQIRVEKKIITKNINIKDESGNEIKKEIKKEIEIPIYKKSENEEFMENTEELKKIINEMEKIIHDKYYECFDCWIG